MFFRRACGWAALRACGGRPDPASRRRRPHRQHLATVCMCSPGIRWIMGQRRCRRHWRIHFLALRPAIGRWICVGRRQGLRRHGYRPPDAAAAGEARRILPPRIGRGIGAAGVPSSPPRGRPGPTSFASTAWQAVQPFLASRPAAAGAWPWRRAPPAPAGGGAAGGRVVSAPCCAPTMAVLLGQVAVRVAGEVGRKEASLLDLALRHARRACTSGLRGLPPGHIA